MEETPRITTPMEVLTMATHVFPTALSPDRVAPGTPALKPSRNPALLYRLFDAIVESQTRRAHREIARYLNGRRICRATDT